jgi:hypothetical protein
MKYCFPVTILGRELIGYESSKGGDIFYQPANLVPVGSDDYTQDQRAEPAASKQYFIETMKKYKNKDGTQKYSFEEINKKASKIYGAD